MFDYEQWRSGQLAGLERWERKGLQSDLHDEFIRQGMIKAYHRVLRAGEFFNDFYNKKKFDTGRAQTAVAHDLKRWGFPGLGHTPADFHAFIEAEVFRASLPEFHLEWPYLTENSLSGYFMESSQWGRLKATCRWIGQDEMLRTKEEGFVFLVSELGVEGWKRELLHGTFYTSWEEQAQHTLAELESARIGVESAPAQRVDTTAYAHNQLSESEVAKGFEAEKDGAAAQPDEGDDW